MFKFHLRILTNFSDFTCVKGIIIFLQDFLLKSLFLCQSSWNYKIELGKKQKYV